MDPVKNPTNYKLGIFYYNKEDKRIFPPKRIAQMGWTINFANPISILVFVAALALIYMVGWVIKP